MNLIKQPNRASCLATAFAMCMGVDVEHVFKILGHDGTEIAFTNLEVPRCYRGFHSAELIWLANSRGFTVMELPKSLDISHDMKDIKSFKPFYSVKMYFEHHDIVLTNGHHAIAWDWRSKSIYDPMGKIYTDLAIDYLYNDFDIFYIFGSKCQTSLELFDLHINGMHEH